MLGYYREGSKQGYAAGGWQEGSNMAGLLADVRPQFEDGRSLSVAPDRTLAQRMEALEKGNVIRTRRAQLKRDLKARRVRVADVLLEPPAWAETMKVIDLLLAVPKMGRVKVNKTLVWSRISASKTLGGMSVRQRTELASMLRGR